MDDGLGVVGKVGTQETEVRNSLKFWIMDEDETICPPFKQHPISSILLGLNIRY